MMRRAFTCAAALALALVAGDARATVTVDGRTMSVVDMHLHPGRYGQIPVSARAFTVAAIPELARLYAPAVFRELLDPFAEHVGIREQTRWAGVDHAVLYAVYTYRTSGFFTNEQLDETLAGAEGSALEPDGLPWAWGFASIDFFGDWEREAPRRLDALSSFFEADRRGRFIGIKLAHAHQAVAFDDPRYLGVYDVAAKHGVPVLLHTGFSPFPNAKTEPAYYDPEGLAQVVLQHDGKHGPGRVDFVLSHVGQGDARSVEHALSLAQRSDNVYLEISALARPLLVDGDGHPITATEPQYPFVLAQIKQRGLANKTLYGSDGPQFSGMGKSYLEKMIAGMKDAGFTLDEIADVLSANFFRLYQRSRPR